MKIAICGSIAFSHEMIDISKKLTEMGHTTNIPKYTQKIRDGEITLDHFMSIKEKEGDLNFRKEVEEDLIKRYYRLIKEADAILVINHDKKGTPNYIGGNTLIELAFAHVFDKPIFLLNEIPKMHYSDEIVAMNPVVIHGNLEKIANP